MAVPRVRQLIERSRVVILLDIRLAAIAAVWIASDAGYYLLMPMLGLRTGYNTEPIAIALYYTAWVAAVMPTFWPLYRAWPTVETPVVTHVILIGLLGGIMLFALYGLPALPRIVWTESWEPPELMRVTAWYFVPKAIEILFQQLLVAALVLILAARRLAVRTISLTCALLFGGIGIYALALGGAAGLAVGITFISLAVITVLSIVAVGTALQSIFTAVLYQYATTGQGSSSFSGVSLASAFRSEGDRA